MKYNNNNNITAEYARAAALNETRLEYADFERIELRDGLYELEFNAMDMHYECYVDATDGEVLGLNYYPKPEAYCSDREALLRKSA